MPRIKKHPDNASVMGRPEAEIDKVLFEKLIKLPLRKGDIANALSISEDTLDIFIKQQYECTFTVLKDKNFGLVKGSILGKQLETAMKGNVTMLIWMGKQYCGQSDKVDQTVTSKGELNITTETPQQHLDRIKAMIKDET